MAAISFYCAGVFAADDDESLARFVPADAGLFVELRGSQDLLVELTEPQLWLGLAELAGQPAGSADAAEWRDRIRRTLGMTPEQAINTLFSRGAAFLGEGPLRSQDAVVLCKPASTGHTLSLINSWKAKPIGGDDSANIFTLRDNIAVGVGDGMMAFGDANPPDGMLRRVMSLARGENQASLDSTPVFTRLRQRVAEDPDGLLFLRLTEGRAPLLTATTQPTTQPTPQDALRLELPGPLRGADTVLLALERSGRQLRFTAVGDHVRPRATPPDQRLVDLVRGLPEKTLAAWGSHVDWDLTVGALQALPPQHIARMVFEIKGAVSKKALPDLLDAPICAAVGFDHAPRSDAPPIPTVALLLSTPDPNAAGAAFASLVSTAVSVHNLLAIRQDQRPIPPAIDELFLGCQVWMVDLSPQAKVLTRGRFSNVHLAWAVDGDVLIIGSNVDWVRRILASRHGEAPTLGNALDQGELPTGARSETVLVLQSGPIADLCRLWLTHLQETMPAVLEEDYWRPRQPGGNDVQLGVRVDIDPEHKRLHVVSVTPGMPADGFLQPGDYVIGCDERAFTTARPAREIRQRMAERPNARWVELLVERDGVLMAPRIPVPFVDPTRVLRQLAAIGQLVQRAVYLDDFDADHGGRGLVTIELRKGNEPLFSVLPRTAAPSRPSATEGE